MLPHPLSKVENATRKTGDPTMADDGRCPACGLIVSGAPGGSVPIHTAPGEKGKCPGSGSTIQPR